MKSPYYFLTIYTVEGHTSWRCHLSFDEKGFEKQRDHDHTKVVQVRQVRVSRTTGEIVAE